VGTVDEEDRDDDPDPDIQNPALRLDTAIRRYTRAAETMSMLATQLPTPH
jgi:hypothetical protein